MKNLFFAGLCTLLALPSFAATNTQQQLAQLAAAGNGIIKLNTETFDLLTAPKRTWSASIQLTALDSRRRCNPCKEFNPSWVSVAKAWATVPADKRNEHFFATIDFDDGTAVFQRLGLASAPVVYHYPATEGPRKPTNGKTSPVKYDFSEGFEAAPLAQYLSQYTPTTIPYRDPIDWTRWITIAVGAVGSLLFLRFISPIVQSKWTWAAVTVVTSLVMTSGYMFTRIRNSPFNGGDGSWIAAGYQNQFGQEVQVVAFIYGLLAFAFLMLTMVVPLQTSPQKQRFQVYIWTAVIMIVYSVLVSLFRVKNRGYPFKLFL
ncbi:Tumor suppressor candidate 3 [Psilocybe cubensis]|uniref:Dolichyl-diphosphooligosaccharide-protein glycotransferase n=2 Tax=Psilocybe cubensis TaxID=181762 RepID=A0A8H7Y0X9_PSICU|nr:Tumor suppressor candidate 3 [Psilocybe cubensis]KAH9484269.1 Tumor suppressor candidate 3 [Psilocybe cubensis]